MNAADHAFLDSMERCMQRYSLAERIVGPAGQTAARM
jgi:hypothetical protein